MLSIKLKIIYSYVYYDKNDSELIFCNALRSLSLSVLEVVKLTPILRIEIFLKHLHLQTGSL